MAEVALLNKEKNLFQGGGCRTVEESNDSVLIDLFYIGLHNP
jgi:hypothetical protein